MEEGKGIEEICVCYKSNSVWGLTANTVIEQNDGSLLTLVIRDALTFVDTVSAPNCRQRYQAHMSL